MPDGREGGRGGRPFSRATSSRSAWFSAFSAAFAVPRSATFATSVPTSSRSSASDRVSSDALSGSDMRRMNHATPAGATASPGYLPRLRLAGIAHVAYFVDQVENFAKYARRQDRDVRILREAMCQTSPTADMASFVFQMHINALQVLEPIWQAEHLP